MKIPVLILLAALFLGSCKAKKAVETDSAADSLAMNLPKDLSKPMNADLVFYENVLLPPQFEQVKISSKLSVETDKTYLPTLDATIYIENNQKVWMNLTAFFINVARGIATPNGIKAFNRADKTYIDSDFDYLNSLLNTNFINYKSLEKLLMGRTFIRISSREFMLTKTTSGYKMASVINQKMESNGSVREYQVELHYANNYDLIQVVMQDTQSADALEVRYDNWENFRNYRLPKNVKIIIKGAKSGQIMLENTKFDDSKINTPFSVPGSYKKIEI